MNDLMDYLWGKGHRRFAYLAPLRHSISSTRRFHAFQRFLQHRSETSSRIVKRIGPGEIPEAVQTIVNAPEHPTVVVCSSDSIAYPFLKCCEDRSISVPDDLAVVGFDGIADWSHPKRNLVTVRVPWNQMAQSAVDLLIRCISGREVPCERILPVELTRGVTA